MSRRNKSIIPEINSTQPGIKKISLRTSGAGNSMIPGAEGACADSPNKRPISKTALSRTVLEQKADSSCTNFENWPPPTKFLEVK